MKKQTVLILAVLIIGATGFVGFKYAEPKETSFSIEYKVECGSCDVSYRNATGETVDVPGVTNGWSEKFTGEKGQFIYVSATNEGGETVKVSILKNGDEFMTNTSAEANVAAKTGSIL